MKNLIVRIAPVSNVPVIFYADSKKDGQIKGYLEGQERMLGLDFYQMTQPMDAEQATQIAMDFAKQQKLNPHEVSVRQRLPKITAPRRKLDNVSLLPAQAAEPPKDVSASAGPSNLQEFAQALQDQHNTSRQGEQKASADNLEGAIVQPRQKRKYTKQNEAQKSAKSAAALRRYYADLEASATKSPTIMEPVTTNATPQEIDKATMDLAIALARILKSNPGVL